jgi:hypothetical protein
MDPNEEERNTKTVLPPFEEWTLPDELTKLHLPCWLPLNKEGEGAAIQLPPQLVELRLGYALDHSLAKLKLPASLRVLRLGAEWNQLAPDWPLLPDGLVELELSGGFNQPLSSLRLPSSLRKLHVLTSSGTSAQERAVSHLFDDPTPGMFPPRLESLFLPPPLNHHSEQELRKKAKAENEGIEPIWTGSAPLNLSLLPSCLRFLTLHRAQALVCNPPSALSSLHVETLSLFHRRDEYSWERSDYSGAEECRQQLQQQLRRTEEQSKALEHRH